MESVTTNVKTNCTTAVQNKLKLAQSALYCEGKPMQQELQAKVMAKILTTKNPYLKGGPTQWPMPELQLKQPTVVSHETPMVALKARQVSESAARNESNL